MKVEHTAEGFQRASTRLTFVTIGLGVSIVTNLILAGITFSSRQTILVPMLPSQVVLSQTEGVSSDYLEAVARDATYLFLNRTPDNEGFFDQQILRIADAQTYQTIRDDLIDAARHTAEGHISQTFVPTDWYVDPKSLYVEVCGNLITNNGATTPEAAVKVYAERFVRHGTSIRLLSFEEIQPKDAVGAKVPLTPAPPPRTTPISEAP